MNKIKFELRKRKENNLNRYQFIGAELKRCRLNLSKTLHAVSGVNRSISYISKIENNKIIPNEESLMELCEELYISREDLKDMYKFDECIEKATAALFYHDLDTLRDLYDVYSKFSFIRTELIKGIYYSAFNLSDDLLETLKKVALVEENLVYEDYTIYAYLGCIIYLINNEYLEAYKLAKHVLGESITNKYIEALFLTLIFKIKVNFGIGGFQYEYEEARNVLVELNNYSEIDELNLLYDRKNIEEVENCDLEQLVLKSHPRKLKKFFIIKSGDKAEIKSFIENNVIDDKNLLICYYLLNDYENFKITLKKVFDNSKESIDFIMGNYYKIKLFGDEMELKNYLHDICLPFCLKRHSISLLLIFYEELCALNAMIFKYKESAIISTDISKVIKEVISVTRL